MIRSTYACLLATLGKQLARRGTALMMSAILFVFVSLPAHAQNLGNITESTDYSLVYALPIPVSANYDGNLPPYSVDNTASITGFDRVAYLMELDNQWLWVSMDAFMTVPAQVGVPVSSTGAVFQQLVSNMNVESNVMGIVTGTGITTGNIEFWHHSYSQNNFLGVPLASSGLYDFGDQRTDGDPQIYGSMQVHNFGAGQTLFAYNAWDSGLLSNDLGIGNSPTGNPDWTSRMNAHLYSARNLYIFVREANLNEPPTADAGADQSIHASGTVNLNGGASFDDNTASGSLDYSWSFSSKPNGSTATLTGANTATPSFVADLTGDYIVQLIVTDEGALDSVAAFVTVSSNNLAPTSVATVDFSLAIIGQPVNFDGSLSTDPELDPLTYAWVITAAPLGSTAALVGANTPTPSLAADLEGDYQVTLTVSDFLGEGTSDTVDLMATTASGFADIQIIEACDLVESLPSGQVKTEGNQRALGNILRQAMRNLQRGEVSDALDSLSKSLDRTDGCALRGSPDGNGPGMDWITDCDAQIAAYGFISDAIAALQL